MGNRYMELLASFPEVLIGAEGEEDQEQQEQNNSEEEEQENDPAPEPKEEDKGDDKDSGAYRALQAERKRAKDLERELKRLRKADEDAKLAEKSDLEQVQTRLQQSEEKTQRLASTLLQRDLNRAIEKAAKDLKFIDTDDALAGVDRTLLSYEQDEDDPANVTIDTKSVERAVKQLATKKPHFLHSGTEDGGPTGSGFGGSKGKKQDDGKKLLEKYPSLG